ncbi:MAG: hypothetical protein ACUVRZ_11675 [Desulfobacca sp.]|uniref:hypothetical protein n=1 Tax=Desulfobacca sp. TaxID=2067990 RepID=UPI00404A2390
MRQAAQKLRANISRPIRENHLWQSVAKFFSKEMARENDELFALGLPQITLALGPRALPLRLGRHSGAECLTIKGFRQIKIKGHRGTVERKDHATTLWLAAHAPERWPEPPRPFGWVVLQRITEELQQECLAREQTWKEKQQSQVKAPPPPVTPKVEIKERTPEPPARVDWEKAMLTWNPGKQELTALGPMNKKATGKGMDLVPAEHQAKLKKKGLQAMVTVEPLGNAWKIVKIEVPGS